MSTDHTNITADILLSDAINNWLRSEYGLGDDDCLSSGDVAECVDMAVKHFLTKQKEEIVKSLRMPYKGSGISNAMFSTAGNLYDDGFNQKLDKLK